MSASGSASRYSCYLIVLTGLLYFTKKRIWHEVKHRPELTEP